MAELNWNVPLFVGDRMVGVANVHILENGGLAISAGATEDAGIAIEDLPHMSAYSLVLTSVKTEGEKILLLGEWMYELNRWWNYETIGNMDEIKVTKAEFLHYMTRHGTEITSQVPEHLLKPPRADPTVRPEGKEGLDGPKQQ
jgi:hypothetical protein